MKLRTKSILVIFIGFSFLTLIVSVTLNTVIAQNYSDLEEKTITEHVGRVLNQLNKEYDDLSSTGFDWSAWDDTYTFVEDKNEEYIQGNLLYESLEEIDINFMIFYNETGILVYNVSYDFVQQKQVSLSDNFYKYISENKEFLFDHPDMETRKTGILVYNKTETPLIICITPIVTSNREGSIHGSLIIGQFLDDEKVQTIGNITDLRATLHLLNGRPAIDIEYPKYQYKGNNIYIQSVNSTYIIGNVIVNDIFGNPVFILEVGSDRDIYQQGLSVIQNLIFSLIISVIVLISIVIFILDRFITSRLTSLANSVNDVKNYKDLSKQLNIKGNDEIATLEKNINNMLHSLQKTWAMKDSAEFSLQKKIDELERFKTITIDREIKMIELKKQLEELKTREGEKT